MSYVTHPRFYLSGEHPLMLRICKDGKKKYRSLGISVNPKYWDFKKNVLKVRENYKLFCNKHLVVGIYMVRPNKQ